MDVSISKPLDSEALKLQSRRKPRKARGRECQCSGSAKQDLHVGPRCEVTIPAPSGVDENVAVRLDPFVFSEMILLLQVANGVKLGLCWKSCTCVLKAGVTSGGVP